MASGHITSWQIDGETMETLRDYFGGLQYHCRWYCSHEIKRGLLLERKGMTNLDSLLKSREFAIFKGISPLFSIVAVLVCIPTNSVGGFPFLHTFSIIYRLFDDGCSDRCEVMPHCTFDLHFANN